MRLLQALVLTLLLLVLLQGFDKTLLQELASPLAYGDCELACRTHKPERRTQPHIA
jgi:hypothetical protein